MVEVGSAPRQQTTPRSEVKTKKPPIDKNILIVKRIMDSQDISVTTKQQFQDDIAQALFPLAQRIDDELSSDESPYKNLRTHMIGFESEAEDHTLPEVIAEYITDARSKIAKLASGKGDLKTIRNITEEIDTFIEKLSELVDQYQHRTISGRLEAFALLKQFHYGEFDGTLTFTIDNDQTITPKQIVHTFMEASRRRWGHCPPVGHLISELGKANGQCHDEKYTQPVPPGRYTISGVLDNEVYRVVYYARGTSPEYRDPSEWFRDVPEVQGTTFTQYLIAYHMAYYANGRTIYSSSPDHSCGVDVHTSLNEGYFCGPDGLPGLDYSDTKPRLPTFNPQLRAESYCLFIPSTDNVEGRSLTEG